MPESVNTPPSPSLGVICARFQVAELHEGHKWLIEQVRARHSHVLIVLGTSAAKMSAKNPLSYEDRKQMLRETYPLSTNVLIDRVADHPSNEYWSQQLDAVVGKARADLGTALYQLITTATLYGSRDSFIPYYSGSYPTQVIVSQQEHLSGTAHRQHICDHPIHNVDYRRGKIAACADRYPVNFMTVDAIIWNRHSGYQLTFGGSILLGRKKGATKFQFIGGFTDPTDASLEAAVRREVGEEVKRWDDYNSRYDDRDTYKAPPLRIKSTKLLGTVRVDDARYRSEADKIMTAVFLCVTEDYYNVVGADDIEEVKWFPVLELIGQRAEILQEIHQPLLDLFLKTCYSEPVAA